MQKGTLSELLDQNSNQSVENAGEAFAKGASERNEFFEEINKQ